MEKSDNNHQERQDEKQSKLQENQKLNPNIKIQTETENSLHKENDNKQTSQQENDLSQLKKKKGQFIYDLFKIKVTINDHYYIFSRFLITRMLTLCRIPNNQAGKIAKDVKKQLVRENRFEIPHQEMEQVLFQQIHKNGFSQNHITRYEMTSKFFRTRVPLIILLGGAPKVGKSMLSTYLAERLNISNVLQTSIVQTMMKTLDPKYFENSFDINQESETEQQQQSQIHYYQKTCQTVRKGVHADIYKSLTEGKPLIIEGYELLPSYYVKKQDIQNDQTKDIQIKQEQEQEEKEDNLEKLVYVQNEFQKFIAQNNLEDKPKVQQKLTYMQKYIENEVNINKTSQIIKILNTSDHIIDEFKVIQPDLEQQSDSDRKQLESRKKDLSKQESQYPIIVPIQLIMNKRDFRYNIENSQQIQQIQDPLEKEKAINRQLNNCLLIQNYLLQQSSLNTIVPVNFHNLEQTIDTIHDIILDKIETAYKRNKF